MFRTEPAIKSYGRVSFPFPQRVAVKDSSGTEVELNMLDRGQAPVVRLSIIWERAVAKLNEKSASLVMTKSLREGTADYSQEQIEEILDFNGAWLVTSSRVDAVVLHIYSLNHRLKHILPLLESLISKPSFPRNGLDHVKETEADSLKINELKVERQAVKALYRLILGPENPKSLFVGPDDVMAVAVDEVSESFVNRIENVKPVFWLAGKLDREVIDEVEGFIGRLHVARNYADSELFLPTPSKQHRQAVDVPGAKQSAVRMGIPLPSPTACGDFNKIRLTVTALGGYFGSRLNKIIREEQGLTYGIHSYTEYDRHSAMCVISAQTSPENVEKLIDSTLTQLDTLASNPPETTEIESLKEQIKSSVVSTAESPFQTADLFIELSLKGLGLDFLHNYLDTLENITPSDFSNTTSGYLLAKKPYIVTAGPGA